MALTTSSVVADRFRLASVARLGVLDTPPEAGFDRLTRMAARVLGVPIALVTIVDGDRQFFKSSVGLPDPWATLRETPLSHSFCQHTLESRAPLVVEDARVHPLLSGNLAIRDLGVVAYAGVPLLTSTGVEIGTFCAIDNAPRRWSAEDEALLRDLAMMAVVLIEYRALHEARAPSVSPPAGAALDRQAAELLQRHGDDVYRLAVAVAGDEPTAGEAVAEGLHHALRAPGATRAHFAVQARKCALAGGGGGPCSALAGLDEEERCVVELACYAGLGVDEIADELALPRRVVMQRMTSGMRALRGALA